MQSSIHELYEVNLVMTDTELNDLIIDLEEVLNTCNDDGRFSDIKSLHESLMRSLSILANKI